MKSLLLYRPGKKRQYLLSLSLVIAVVLVGLSLYDLTGYRVTAFMLLVTVSILAMFFEIIPVLMAAILSALLWDLLFIPPRFTFTVGTAEDRGLLLMYFIIASINAVLTSKLRNMEKQVQIREEKAKTARFYDALLNSLSHELRTPITAIIAATDNLNSDTERIAESSRKELVNEISIAALRLNQQVENLLSMSRLESGVVQIKKDWCDIRELIYTTLKRFDPKELGTRVTVFVPDHLPFFKLDFGLMVQVLNNLIGNALQHTPADTGIVVEAHRVNNNLVITVADNGHGFPEKEISKVFDRFYRLRGSRPGGTGLGLSIARGFIEAHNGSITLQNLPLSGAVFTIEIPAESSSLNSISNDE